MMKQFVIYRSATGEIEGTAQTTEALIEIQLSEGQGFVEGTGNPDTHVVQNGRLRVRHRLQREKIARLNELDNLAKEARALRDQLLASSDYTQLADAPGDAEPWSAYRALLRAVPEQSGFPTDIKWPVPPVTNEEAQDDNL